MANQSLLPSNRRLFQKPSPILNRDLTPGAITVPATPGFHFKRTRLSQHPRVEVPNSQNSPAKLTSQNHQSFNLANSSIMSPSSSIDAKEEAPATPAVPAYPPSHRVEKTEGAENGSSIQVIVRHKYHQSGDTHTEVNSAQPLPVSDLKSSITRSHQQAQNKDLSHISTTSDESSGSDDSDNSDSDEGERETPNPVLGKKQAIGTSSAQLGAGISLQEKKLKDSLPIEHRDDHDKKGLERETRAATAGARVKLDLETAKKSIFSDLPQRDQEATADTQVSIARQMDKDNRAMEVELNNAGEEETRAKDLQEAGQERAEEQTRLEHQKGAPKVEREGSELKQQEEKSKLKLEVAEKRNKKKEQEEARRLEKERKDKEKAELVERKKREKAELAEQRKQQRQERALKAAKAKESKKPVSEREQKVPGHVDVAGIGGENSNIRTPNAVTGDSGVSQPNTSVSDPPTVSHTAPSKDSKKRARELRSDDSVAEEVTRGKKRKATQKPNNNNDLVLLDLFPQPKIASALKSPIAKPPRSVSFADLNNPDLTSEGSKEPTTQAAAVVSAAKVIQRTPILPPGYVAPPTKKTPSVKAKVDKKKPIPQSKNRKLSQEIVESSDESKQDMEKAAESDEKPQSASENQVVGSNGEGAKKVGNKESKPVSGLSTSTASGDGSEHEVPDVVRAGSSNTVRVTRQSKSAMLHTPLPKSTRNKTPVELAAPEPTQLEVPNDEVESTSDSDDEEDEEEDGKKNGDKSSSTEKAHGQEEVRADAKVLTSHSHAKPTSVTKQKPPTPSPSSSESDSGSEDSSSEIFGSMTSPQKQKQVDRVSLKVEQVAATKTPPPRKPAMEVPPSSQKYKSLSEMVLEEPPEVMEKFAAQASSQASQRPKPAKDSDEDESGSGSDSYSDSDSSSGSSSDSDSSSNSGVNIIPNDKRAGARTDSAKRQYGGRSSLGGFFNRSKSANFLLYPPGYPDKSLRVSLCLS